MLYATTPNGSVGYRASRCFVARYFCRVFATRSLSSQSTTLLRTILSNLFLTSLHYVLQKYIKRLARNRAGLSFCFCYPLRSEERSYDNISCRPTWYSLNGGPSCGRTADFRSGGLQALRSPTDWPGSINELRTSTISMLFTYNSAIVDCSIIARLKLNQTIHRECAFESVILESTARAIKSWQFSKLLF